MAKKNNPNKGFVSQLEKVQAGGVKAQGTVKTQWNWKQPQSGAKPSADPGKTMHRMQRQTGVKKTTEITSELAKFIEERRTKK